GRALPRPDRRGAARRRTRARRRRAGKRHRCRAEAVPADPPARIDRRPHLRAHVPRAGRRGLRVHVRVDEMLARIAFAAAALLAVAVAEVGPAAAAGSQVSVYFVQGEQLVPVKRPGTTALDAVRQLVAGPTPAERGLGFRTYLPADTRVRSVTVAN